MSFFTYAQIFADLLLVAQKETCCFVWQTAAGLVVIDAIWPDKRAYDAIIAAVTACGWNPADLCKLVLTHGHLDHTGCGRWLVQHHGVKTYLSRTDDLFWREHPVKPDRPKTWKDFDIDVYVDEVDLISCGDKSISVYATPGHTPGCLSYLLPVTDNGEQHLAALWDGATPPWGNRGGIRQFLNSLTYFEGAAAERGADVMLCNHTVFDNGLERLAYSAKKLAYMPSIYVLGCSRLQKFFSVFRRLDEDELLA